MGLSKGLAKTLPDQRDPDRITHSLESLLQQRIYGLALGYEDLNDHDTLRSDLLWQAAAERDELLSGSSTLCRWENRAGRQEARLMHQVLLDQFMSSFAVPPAELVLDFDAPVIGSTADSSERPSTATITITAFYRSMSSVASSCW